MKTLRVLIPTDFTSKSLVLVKKTLDKLSHHKLQIILVSGESSSGSISSMLFYNKEKHIKALSNQKFNDVYTLICNKYASQIESFRIDILTGNNKRYFKNYLDANNIDEVIIPLNINLDYSRKNSFNPVPLFESVSKKQEIDIGEYELSNNLGQMQISSLFL